MKLSTTNVNEKKYVLLGLVHGMQVKSLNILRNFLSGIASVVGTGESDWTGIKDIFAKAKEEAFNEMQEQAKKLNAEEIIGIKTEISQISHGDSDGMLVVSVVGTAVKKRNQKQSGGNKKTRSKSKSKTKSKCKCKSKCKSKK